MKKMDKKIHSDPLEDGILHIPEAQEPISRVYEVFQSLTEDEIEEMLHLIVTEVSPDRLHELASGLHTRGAFDLVMDKIGYYHFLRPVDEFRSDL